jgi:hypothetical protein
MAAQLTAASKDVQGVEEQIEEVETVQEAEAVSEGEVIEPKA